jgi:hypothetical protein
MTRRKTRAAIVPKSWPLLCDAVESGIVMGWNHAHKHTDTPRPEQVQEQIAREVLNAISERFHIPDDYAE